MRFLSLGGLLAPLLFAVVIAVSAQLRPGYSHVRQFISELGATGTPNASVMNHAGFLPAGLLLAAFGIALLRLLPGDRLGLLGGTFVLLFGLGIAASGPVSCDPGCPQTGGSTENLVHNRIGPLAFLSGIVGTGLLGLHFRRLPEWRPLWRYSLVTSGLALVFLVALASSVEARELTGLWQRLLLATLFAWCGVLSLRMLRP